MFLSRWVLLTVFCVVLREPVRIVRLCNMGLDAFRGVQYMGLSIHFVEFGAGGSGGVILCKME